MCAAKNLPLPAAIVNVQNVQHELGSKETALPAFVPQPTPPGGEAFSEALAVHLAELEPAGIAATTIAGYRQQGEAFIAFGKDLPLPSITRAMASDFLDHLAKRGIGNRSLNKYAMTLAAVFDCATRRGRFEATNPFRDQRRKVEERSYEPFTSGELSQLFASMVFETKPPRYSTASALPWAAAIATYTGCRLEEVAQLRREDLRQIDGIWCFDINEAAGRIKNRSSKRIVPVHSELIRIGLLKYHAALPRDAARLFPSLTARESKGGKLGPALGDGFEVRRKQLGITRPNVCFHSFRHGVASALDRAGVSEVDAARILGHRVAGMSFGLYSQGGPGLARLRAVVEKVGYPGFRL
jgi:integrase